MARSRRLLVALAGMCLSLLIMVQTGMTASAGSNRNYLSELNAGVASILNPSATNTAEILNATKKELQLEDVELETEESTLVMANVKKALNIRAEAKEDAEKIGKLYKDCGGTILERADGWTKLQSGNVVGWAKDEYLLFGEEARALADEVGKTICTINEATVRVRQEPSTEAVTYGLLPKGEIMEVIDQTDNGWVSVDFEGKIGYISAECVDIDFWIDKGETSEEIKAREEAEQEAKRHVNYGEYTTDADTTMLLAALIHCEARGESYEGQVAVGAVVMNRVRSKAYPDTIHGVIYASGQFTPAMSGAVNRVLESGKINQSCIDAAKDALSGTSPVGDCTSFRRNNGTRKGIVIGNHIFF